MPARSPSVVSTNFVDEFVSACGFSFWGYNVGLCPLCFTIQLLGPHTAMQQVRVLLGHSGVLVPGNNCSEATIAAATAAQRRQRPNSTPTTRSTLRASAPKVLNSPLIPRARPRKRMPRLTRQKPSLLQICSLESDNGAGFSLSFTLEMAPDCD